MINYLVTNDDGHLAWAGNHTDEKAAVAAALDAYTEAAFPHKWKAYEVSAEQGLTAHEWAMDGWIVQATRAPSGEVEIKRLDLDYADLGD